MLIRNPMLGAALARTLGDAPVALMRGHGNVVVGRSIPEAVFRAVYTEVNARLASEALRLGGGQVAFLNEEEAKAAAETNAAQIGRPWELWKAKALLRAGLKWFWLARNDPTTFGMSHANRGEGRRL